MLNKWRLIKSCRKQFAIVAGVCYLVTFLLIFNSFELRNDAVREEDFLHALSEYDMDVYALVDMAEMTHGDATGRNLSKIQQNATDNVVITNHASSKTALTSRAVSNHSAIASNRELVTLPDSALKELASGLMKYPRPTYIKESRNPCFYVNVTENPINKWFKTRKVLYCLPLVYLAGFAKAGSSDLHQNIIQHQHIIPGNMKEPQYWFHSVQVRYNEVRFGNMLEAFYPIKQLVERQCLSSNVAIKSRHKSSELRQRCQQITIDSSPMYLYEAIDWEKDPLNPNKMEPMVLTPHKLKHFLDCPKIIVLMRDPVERLFSDFRFFAEGKNGSGYFHKLVVNGIEWWKQCIQQLPLYKCAFGRDYSGTSVPSLKPDGFFDWGDTETYGHNGANRVRFSIYVIYIMKWLEVFPHKCFLFVKTEEYNKNPIKVLREQIYPFLELEPLAPSGLSHLEKLQKKGHVNKTRKMNISMYPDTKQLLQDFYKPYNEQLVKLLNDNRFRWF